MVLLDTWVVSVDADPELSDDSVAAVRVLVNESLQRCAQQLSDAIEEAGIVARIVIEQ